MLKLPVTARLFGRLALVFAVVITIGCDRVTKHVATRTLAGAPDRSYWGTRCAWSTPRIPAAS